MNRREKSPTDAFRSDASKRAVQLAALIGVEIANPEAERAADLVFEEMRVTEPIYESPADRSGLVTAFLKEPRESFGDSSVSGGVCVRAGNLRFNPRKLFGLGMSGLKALSSHAAVPWVLFLLSLYDVTSGMRIDLTKVEVRAFRAIWEIGRGERPVADADILQRVNAEQATEGEAPLSEKELERALAALLSLGCIRNAEAFGCWFVADVIEYQYR